ncbi:MAG: hypothetical protein QOD62_1081, partial [Actinomycetota bacterium]|nr:hypothetical protein [Actinomycetota bacterium]
MRHLQPPGAPFAGRAHVELIDGVGLV